MYMSKSLYINKLQSKKLPFKTLAWKFFPLYTGKMHYAKCANMNAAELAQQPLGHKSSK